MSLAGQRVLVVRPQIAPEHGGDRLVSLLADAGATVAHLPVMTLNPITEGLIAEQAKSAVMDLDHFSAAIFISRPAANLGLELIDRYWPQLPLNTRFYAVGKSTADILRSYPIDVQAPDGEFTSEGLLQLQSLQNLQHQKVLIFRGEGGREHLADQLRERGAEVTYAELYRREVIFEHQSQICQQLQQGVAAVVVHSGEILQALLSQLRDKSTDEQAELGLKLRETVLLVPSERVAKLAAEQGFRHILTAASALPEEMVSALSE